MRRVLSTLTGGIVGIAASAETLRALDLLAETGFYGLTRAAVAACLLEERLEQLAARLRASAKKTVKTKRKGRDS